MLEIKKLVFNPLQENTYVVWDETKQCIIIDPGCSTKDEEQKLKDFITTKELEPVMLVNTHCHVDHVLGNQFVKDTFKVKLFIHEKAKAELESVKVYAPAYGIHNYHPAIPDVFWTENDKDFTFGNTTLEIRFTPGHSPGSISFIHHETKNAFSGDVLFRDSIGRSDLPGGDYDILKKSIFEQLFTLDPDFEIYSGHGPSTNIGHEMKYNPFLGV